MKYRFLLLILILLAFLLRFLGIKFNLPYIEFTDEINVANDALNIVKTFNFKEFHFLYPPFHAYLQSLVLLLFAKLFSFDYDFISRTDLFLILRSFVAFLGVFSVWLVYKIVERLTSNKLAALFSTLFIAFNFTHIAYSELVKNDVPMLFFGLLSFLMSVNIFKEGRNKWYFWACFFAALSFSTAYLGIIFIVPVIVAHFLYKHRQKTGFVKSIFSYNLVISIFGFLIGVFISNPIIFLDKKLFFDRVSFSNGLLAFYQKPLDIPAWRWYFSYLFGYGLYYPVFLLSIGGIIFLFKKRFEWFLLLFSFIFAYGIAILPKNNYYTDRLSLPLIPFLIIFAGIFLSSLYHLFLKRFKNKNLLNFIVRFFIFLFFFVLFFRVAIVSFQKTLPTPLQQMDKWTIKNIPEKSSILFTPISAKFVFSPNEIEKRYNLFYAYPEIIKRPVDSLSLSYDYILLYWPGNLPKEWVNQLDKNFTSLKDFQFASFPYLKFLNSYARISNPFVVARGPNNAGAKIFILPERTKINYIIFKEIKREGDLIEGKFYFVKGDPGLETKVIYSTDFSLTSDTGSQKYDEYFKPFILENNFNFRIYKDGSIIFDKVLPDSRLNNLIKDNLESNLNLKNNIKSDFLGVSDKDFCSLGGYCRPSGHPDLHFQILGVKKEIMRIVLSISQQSWMSPFNGAYPDIYLERNGEMLDLYLEPFATENKSEDMNIIIYYNDGTYSLLNFK